MVVFAVLPSDPILHGKVICDKGIGNIFIRVRTILVLGYWVLGSIHRYWVVLVLGDIFVVVLTPSTIQIRQQSAPCTCQWMII